MTDVVWVSRHDDILSRGYADQGLLEAILDRTLWTPPDPLTFRHHEDVGREGDFPDVEGAVVIVPARHHAAHADVEWLRAQLDRLAWSVTILCGDEEWVFPWRQIPRGERRKVWVMQPRPEHSGMVDGMLPGGWYPGTLEGLADVDPQQSLSWFFAGQVTHRRRQECVRALRAIPKGHLHPTKGYLQGIPREEYLRLLATAKIAPCPSGPMTVDTARPLEALEAGCVPIVDTITPRGESYDYWQLCFGDNPLQRIRDWHRLPQEMRRPLVRWPQSANVVGAWWQGWKRSVSLDLEAQIREAAGVPSESTEPGDLVTVVVTTSPVPVHPSTEYLDETLDLIRAQLPRAEVIVAFDGVRPEQKDRAPDYAEYVRRALWEINRRDNVVPYLASEWLHQATLTRRALELVCTPLVLFVEHDRPPIGEIPWDSLCRAVISGRAKVVRLHAEAEIHPEHRYLMPDDEPLTVEGVPLRRTRVWWQHPHLTTAERYRSLLEAFFGLDDKTMIEDRLYSACESAWEDDGEEGWGRWGVWIYQPPDDMKRSTHLDARQDDPKFPMDHRRSGPRLGLIVRCDHRGLGIQTYEFWRHLRPVKTLCVTMGRWSPHVREHPEMYPGARVVAFNGRPGARALPDEALQWLLDDVDVILAAETPYDYRLWEWARQAGVRTIVQANPDLYRHAVDPVLPNADVVVNPSTWKQDLLGGVVLPLPVARDRLPYRARTEARRFLHVVGHGAIHDRAGTELVLEAMTYVTHPIDLTVRTQRSLSARAAYLARTFRRGSGSLTVLRGDVEDYASLYNGYDVLVAPRRYGGQSLPLNEAASCGLAIVATDREPERSVLDPDSLVPVASRTPVTFQSGPGEIESANPRALAAKLDQLWEEPALVERLSKASDVYAALISWEALMPRWRELIGGGA